MTLGTWSQSDRPVVSASRTLGALSLIAGAVPTVGTAFEWIAWTANQTAAYGLAVGTVVAAVALFLGVKVEHNVTPTNNPRDDAGNPLTPGPIGADDPDQLPPI